MDEPPLVSVICPTCAERQPLHHLVHRWFAAQDHARTELIVVDDAAHASPFFSSCTDARVRYMHTPSPDAAPLSVGAKRNAAIAASSGDVICHFDDDDCYAPAYVRRMLECLVSERADVCKLGSWFAVDVGTGAVGHVDWAAALPFPFSAQRDAMRSSYGFSFAYRRAVAACVPFPDSSWGEDAAFFKTAQALGLPTAELDDGFGGGLALHTLHSGSTSQQFAQRSAPAASPPRAAGRFLAEALACVDGALGPIPADEPPATDVPPPRRLFVWEAHASCASQTSGAPDAALMAWVGEPAEWELQGGDESAGARGGPPTAFRAQMARQRAARAADGGAGGARAESAGPLPERALAEFVRLGGRTKRSAPFPLRWEG